MREAQAAHVALDDVPTLPCSKHGILAASLTDLERVAYECYAMLSQDRQFQYRERQKGRKRYWQIDLDYRAIAALLTWVVPDQQDHAEVVHLLRIIHKEVYGGGGDDETNSE